MFPQLLRVLVLLLAVPPLAILLDAPKTVEQVAAHLMDLPELAVLLAMAITVERAGTRLWIPAACLLTGLIASAIAHMVGLASGTMPDWLIFLAFAITGLTLGTRLSRVGRRQMTRFAAAGVATVLVALVLSLGFAALTAAFISLPLEQIWIAYAPGSVEASTAVGLAFGYDPAFVALHHFARYWRWSCLSRSSCEGAEGQRRHAYI